MKSRRKIGLFLLGIFFGLFFLSVTFQDTYAYFTDSCQIAGDLSLKTGTVALTKATSSPSAVTLKAVGEKQTIQTEAINSGTLASKLTLRLARAEQNGAELTAAQLREYLSWSSNLDQTALAPGGSRVVAITLTKVKDWAGAQPLTLTFYIRSSQTNLTTDATGFVAEQPLQVTVTSVSSASDDTVTWPSDDHFANSNLYVGETLYYSTIDGQLTTVLPGLIYLKYRSGTSVSAQEQAQVIAHLQKSIKQNGSTAYHVEKAVYVEQKGFAVTLTMSEAFTGSYTWLDLSIDALESGANLSYVRSNEFGKPFMLTSDIAKGRGLKPDTTIHASQAGTIDGFGTPEGNGSVTQLQTQALQERLQKSAAISFSGADADYFSYRFESDSQLAVVQAGAAAGKTAQLIIKDTAGKVVFSRKVVSIEQEEFASEVPDQSQTAYAISTTGLYVTQSATGFTGSGAIYIKLPADYLTSDDLAVDNSPGFTIDTISYTPDLSYMKLTIRYASTTSPNFQAIHLQFTNSNKYTGVQFVNSNNLFITQAKTQAAVAKSSRTESAKTSSDATTAQSSAATETTTAQSQTVPQEEVSTDSATTEKTAAKTAAENVQTTDSSTDTVAALQE